MAFLHRQLLPVSQNEVTALTDRSRGLRLGFLRSAQGHVVTGSRGHSLAGNLVQVCVCPTPGSRVAAVITYFINELIRSQIDHRRVLAPPPV